MKLLNKMSWKMSRSLLMALIGALYLASANAIPVTVVNLDARVNDLSSPVDLLLAPGTYTVDAIGVADGGAWNAWNAWGTTNCSNADGCDRTGTIKYKGWLNIYSFASPELVDVTINGDAVTPIVGDLYKVNPRMAFPDPLSALANAWAAEFTLNTASTVSFAITDTILNDNLGGMSLNVALKAAEPSADIPEPSSFALFALAGFVSVGFSKRKKA